MNRQRTFFSAATASVVAVLTLVFLPALSLAQSEAVPSMARIVAELEHFPSAEQKKTLSAISQDDSNSQASQTIAEAIRNIEHKPRPEDVAALQAIAEDASASEAEKQLAEIVMDINHKASPKAQQTLESLAQQP